jgi:hypothetical protein
VGQPLAFEQRAASRLFSRISSIALRTKSRVRQSSKPSVEARPSGRAQEARQDAARPVVHVSTPDESLIFFILRLLERMREMGTAPAADLVEYGRSLRSFRR